MNRLTPLAAAFTVLLALVVWRETTRGSSKTLVEEANLKTLQVRAFTADDVAKVEVTAPGADKPAYTLVREDKSWRVLGAFKAPASGAEVTKLVTALAKADGEFRTDDKAALDQFGLTPAKAVGLRVLDKDGKDLVHLAVGGTANSRGAFVRDLVADDSKAYTVGADLRAMLGLSRTSGGAHDADKPDAAHFHDKEFPQLAVENPKRAEFAAPGRVVVFEKTKKDDKDKVGEWKAASGGPDATLKKDAIETAIAKLGGSFHPTALVDPARKKELGFDAPKWRLAVTTETGSPRVVVACSDAANEHYYVRIDAAQDPETLYEATEYEFHQLFPTGAALFDLPKIDTTKDPPTRIVVARKGRETIDMTRKGVKPADDWTLVAPSWPLASKQTQLRNLSTQPGAVRVEDWTDEAPAGDPEVVVRFGAAGAPDEQLKTLALYGKAADGKDRLASLPGGKPGRFYAVVDSIFEHVAPEPLTLFETKIFHDCKRDDATAVRVAGGAAVVKDGDAWKLETDPQKPAADKAAVDAWLDKLLALDVAGVPPTALKDETFTSVSVERKEGAPLAVEIGPAADGKRIVKIGAFRASVADAPGLLPDAASLLPKAPEPPKKDEKPKDDGKK